MQAKNIPTESFVTANERIMATVMSGQLTKDRNLCLNGLHSPTKYDKSIIQSSNIRTLVDGCFYEPYDGEDHSVIIKRGYVPETNIVFAEWVAGEFEVREEYFIPPDMDIVVHQFQIRNRDSVSHDLKLFAIMYSQLGSGPEYKKGICKRSYYDQKNGFAICTDLNDKHLVYAFDKPADRWQIGELCGQTDIFYDLEDGKLSCNSELVHQVANFALEINCGAVKAGEACTYQLCIATTSSEQESQDLIERFRNAQDLYGDTVNYWNTWLKKGAHFGDVSEFGSDAQHFAQMGRVMLKTHKSPDGILMCGSTAPDYQGAVAARNSCYSQLAMTHLGYANEVKDGFKHFLDFKVGDDRFCSPDENDQLGMIIHCFKKYYDFTEDIDFIKDNYPKLKIFVNSIIALIDPKVWLVYSERSIHEYAAISRGYETYVNVMACRGLLDAAWLGKLVGDPDKDKINQNAELIRSAILQKLYCPNKQTFAKRIYKGKIDLTPAISMYCPALFDIIDASDEKVTTTIDYLMGHIWDKKVGGLYRYPPHLVPWESGPYVGPWVTYTCWLARIYIKRGELHRAAECIQWVIDNCPSDSCTIPEHFSINHAGQRGYHRVYYFPAIPETWATAEFLLTLYNYQQARGKMVVEPHQAIT